jgi:hypothetical protein
VVTFFLFGGEERTDDFDDMGLSEMFVLRCEEVLLD